jgi:hypothetical protein
MKKIIPFALFILISCAQKVGNVENVNGLFVNRTTKAPLNGIVKYDFTKTLIFEGNYTNGLPNGDWVLTNKSGEKMAWGLCKPIQPFTANLTKYPLNKAYVWIDLKAEDRFAELFAHDYAFAADAAFTADLARKIFTEFLATYKLNRIEFNFNDKQYICSPTLTQHASFTKTENGNTITLQ